MAVDLATLALRVDSLEVAQAERRLDDLVKAGGRAEKATGTLASASKALAATLATLKVADLARESALMAARYETLGAVVRVVGNNAGYTGDQMRAYEQSLRSTGIAMTESRETLAKMASAHIDLSKATDLARAAQDAAVIGQINSSEAFDRMISGIRSAEVEILRGIGINVNFETAYAKMAAQIGKSAKDLTEYEKVQARTNIVLQAAAANAGVYEESMGTAGKMLSSMQRYTDDLKVSLGEAFGPSVTLLVDQMTIALKDANKEVVSGQSTVQEWGRNFLSIVISVEAEIIRLAMLIDKAGGTLTTLATRAGQTYDFVKNLPNNAANGIMDLLDPNQNVHDDIATSESALTAWGKRWNKTYEDRYNAGDKALQALADREYQLLNATNATSNANEQARMKAGAAARTAAEEEEKAMSAKKKAEESAKKAASEAEKQAREYQAVIDRLLPLEAAQRDYNESLAALDKMDPTHQTERYKIALENLNREYRDSAENAGRYAKEVEAASRAAKESELTLQGIKIDTAVAGGQLSSYDALPFQVDLLRQRLALQTDYLSNLKKSTPEEITAWNSQAEAIAQTNLQLAEQEKLLRLQDPWEAAKQGFRDYADEATKSGESIRRAMVDSLSSMEDALVQFVTTGKFEFSTLADSIISDLARIAIQRNITGPLSSALGSALSGLWGGGSTAGSTVSSNFSIDAIFSNALGGVYKTPGLSAYSNTIVDRPTVFPFAKGIGLMGEAGAEAIMPLARNGKGELGVKAANGTNVTVNVYESSSKAGTVQQRQENGVNVIDVFVDRVKSSIASDIARGNGVVTGALQSTYGLNRALGAR